MEPMTNYCIHAGESSKLKAEHLAPFHYGFLINYSSFQSVSISVARAETVTQKRTKKVWIWDHFDFFFFYILFSYKMKL